MWCISLIKILVNNLLFPIGLFNLAVFCLQILISALKKYITELNIEISSWKWCIQFLQSLKYVFFNEKNLIYFQKNKIYGILDSTWMTLWLTNISNHNVTQVLSYIDILEKVWATSYFNLSLNKTNPVTKINKFYLTLRELLLFIFHQVSGQIRCKMSINITLIK